MTARAHLRHTSATLAYRGGRALRDVQASFTDFDAGQGTRMPQEILAHMGDLMAWALTQARGAPRREFD